MQRLVLTCAVLSIVFGVGLAQNRGSSRYVPQPDDFEPDDITRQQPPTRVVPNRRHRTTPAANLRNEDEAVRLNEQQPSGRRTISPQRLPEPVGRPSSIYGPPLESTHVVAESEPESKPPPRRRRPKKRRRPQTSEVSDSEKQGIPIVNEDRRPITTLIDDDRKRPRVITHKEEAPTRIEEPNDSQFFRLQPPTNRLPVRHEDPSQHDRYSNLQPETKPDQHYDIRSEYKPALPSEEGSRLPPNRYQNERDEIRTVPHIVHSDEHSRLPPNRIYPVAVPESDRHVDNNLLKNTHSQGSGPSDTRLPQKEQPIFSPDYKEHKYSPQPGVDYGSEDEHSKHIKPTSDNRDDGFSNPSNRLTNPSEVRYESANPSDDFGPYELSPNFQNSPRVRLESIPQQPGTRQRSRNSINSHDTAGPSSLRKPQEIDDEQRTRTRYQTPIQSKPSRYQPDVPENQHRSRSTSRNVEATTPSPRSRSRSSSRYQPSRQEEQPTGYQAPDVLPTYQADKAEKVDRGPPRRHQPDVRQTDPVRSRGLSRNTVREPVSNTEFPRENGRQVPQTFEASYRAPSETPQPYVGRPQTSDEIREDTGSLRHTLRSRPQYESIQPYAHIEPEDSEDLSREEPVIHEPRNRNRPQSYQAPSNEYSPPRQRPPQYQSPESSRTDRHQDASPPRRPQVAQPSPPARHPSQQNRRPQPTFRQPEAEAPSSPNRASRFQCPDPYGFFADPGQCDKYYECRNGTAFESLCQDGLAFNEISAPKYLRCDSLRDVDCNSRPKLQEARSTKNCPRRYGLYPHGEDCTKFWNCVDGVATEVQCPPGLTYNDDRATCDWADLVKSSCKTEELLGFTCPEPTAFDLQDGVYTRYAHPSNCQLHFTCIKGADGQRRPRMLSCGDYQVFDESSGTCRRPEDVPGCEDFFGERRPSTRRQPAREPEEEPEPEERKPKRRNQNRRARN